ncbi:Signal transduction histidine-protein kinase BarA [compost metagenome]|uniref:response regulator n=1 Tax=Pedobacter sp. ok626 TaxID=1761882 RepID=UPI0008875B0A|nr:response regulator [Pedobacter sp. ok626]SDL60014.1 CheY chemotaxis protein or a CheY-like REC (receiver) domain [Pedobacter sp. ok626]
MSNNHKTVLLIDDNDVDLKINSKIIKISNLFEEIITCLSAEEALNYLHTTLNNGGKLPDFILLDIQMPDMDGFEFLEVYKDLPKRLTQNCSIAMLSSTLDFGDLKRAEASPHVVKLLKKPLLPKELAEVLKKHLHS